ncbi:hypothetical protein [Streptomyces sp. NBC_01264]|uniref:hypothetical protein n=1 Tax=Streptomyces sp. NBC_01264 TaxID=2903804 RepID=UPI002252EE9D|nr:hypothetical protein [Streptomyces sp. NBC_01264]MCX4783135.1 hypothetical protein [Streptomyces sp. NBC_01264]
MAADQQWKLDAGTAWILPAGDEGIVKPLVLAGKAGPGETDLADTDVDALRWTAAERTGNATLAVGGIGRGALAVRYALAGMEHQRQEHRAGTYFSFNGAAPSVEERAELDARGGWPRQPRKVRLVIGDVVDGLSDADFDHSATAPADPEGLLIPTVQASWLLEHTARA